MGARLLPDLLYKSELAERESLLEPLPPAEFPTDDPKPPKAEPMAAPRELLLPNPRDVFPGCPGPCENRELLWELLVRELFP